jgi:predicted ATPase
LPESFTDLQLPTTVQGVLTARIDRLGTDEKALLQTLAVMGKEFPFSLLKHVVNQSEDKLQPLLFHLQEAEFIYERPAFPVESIYTRARELCQQVGETSQLFWVLAGLGVFYLLRGELRTTHELAQQTLALTHRAQDSALLPHAHRALGTSLFWRGDFTPAQEYLEQGIALYDPQQQHPPLFLYGLDAGVAAFSLAAHVLWYLGYPDQALKKSQQSLTLAQELSHPHSLAFALSFTARIHHFRGEVQAAQERAEALLTLATEQGFVQWEAQALLYLGRVLAEQGQTEEGVAQIRQGLATWRAIGAELGRTYYLAWMA